MQESYEQNSSEKLAIREASHSKSWRDKNSLYSYKYSQNILFFSNRRFLQVNKCFALDLNRGVRAGARAIPRLWWAGGRFRCATCYGVHPSHHINTRRASATLSHHVRAGHIEPGVVHGAQWGPRHSIHETCSYTSL